MTASALLIAGLVTAGSTTNTTVNPQPAPQAAPEALLAARATDGAGESVVEPASDLTVGLVPAAPEAPRKLSALTPPSDGSPLLGSVSLQNIALPGGTGALGIPEIVLAAYRNAELALESSTPGCGLSWSLLAGIGRIESFHAGSGRTDAAGTTVSPIYGPALDGTLPGNEVIPASGGGFVRAIGPMQFLPGTWSLYAADGNGDGVADPHNVFDSALAAGKYLCSGGLDLRDSQQQLKAVLRYNNSMSYAAQVLSWAQAYKTGGAPAAVDISDALIAPGSLPQAGPDMTAAVTEIPTVTTTEAPATTVAPETQTQVMITIPGLPAIPCGVFCPAPIPDLNACEQAQDSAPKPNPVDPARDPNEEAAAPEAGQQPGQPEVFQQVLCTQPQPQQQPAEQAQQPQPAEQPEAAPEVPAVTEEPAPMAPAEPAAPETTPAPGITLPFGITIPLPAPAPAPVP
ncbi:lytic transglycosylase domain-containing protein [Nocardia sp. NPDC127526]|uniref:lytic transglycosylase domain-containing protein n=1 Tax=Nocardia sp. NPDC127526 TaxID=3345393 RepID=UPI003638A011